MSKRENTAEEREHKMILQRPCDVSAILFFLFSICGATTAATAATAAATAATTVAMTTATTTLPPTAYST